ncbi:MAG TPA: T9SS type A sorting domain-containing protein [Saprospiraceae bacterium]|nr:T9SS type A sorting domain-containing protein [Saprospiraceae bacterium]
MKKQWWFLLLLLPGSVAAQQQMVLSSAGMQQANAKLQVTVTIGEPFVALAIGSGQMFTEGFQQGFLGPELPDLAVDRIITAADWGARIYPNPAVEFLQVSLELAKDQSCRLQIINSIGALVLEAETSEASLQLDIQHLAPGAYWLLLIPSNQTDAHSYHFSKINL